MLFPTFYLPISRTGYPVWRTQRMVLGYWRMSKAFRVDDQDYAIACYHASWANDLCSTSFNFNRDNPMPTPRLCQVQGGSHLT